MNTRSRELQHPGAGLPSFERIILNGVFKFGCFVQSDLRALKLYQRAEDELLRLATDSDSYDVFEPLLIPRVIGIEDSSRKWSVMMVLDHLNQVNRDIVKIVDSLMSGISPRGEIDVALYKPEVELDWSVVDSFREINFEYQTTIKRLVEQHQALNSSATYVHPWFGRLNAHQWHCLAAAHQNVHRRQAQKIVAMLGVV